MSNSLKDPKIERSYMPSKTITVDGVEYVKKGSEEPKNSKLER